MVGQELDKNVDHIMHDNDIPELEPLDQENIEIALQQMEDNYPNYRK